MTDVTREVLNILMIVGSPVYVAVLFIASVIVFDIGTKQGRRLIMWLVAACIALGIVAGLLFKSGAIGLIVGCMSYLVFIGVYIMKKQEENKIEEGEFYKKYHAAYSLFKVLAIHHKKPPSEELVKTIGYLMFSDCDYWPFAGEALQIGLTEVLFMRDWPVSYDNVDIHPDIECRIMDVISLAEILRYKPEDELKAYRMAHYQLTKGDGVDGKYWRVARELLEIDFFRYQPSYAKQKVHV